MKTVNEARFVKVLVYKVGEKPVVTEIADSLEGMQAVVEGYVEHVRLGGGLDLWCNEDGISLQLPFNRTVEGHRIHGTYFVCRSQPAKDPEDGEEMADVTEADIAKAGATRATNVN